MAREFNGTTQYLSNSDTVLLTSFPFTMAARFNTDTVAVFSQTLLGIYVGGAGSGHYLSIQESGGTVRGNATAVGGGGSFAHAFTTNTVTASAWSSLVGRWNSASSRTSVLNADFANAGSNTSTREPTGLTTMEFGRFTLTDTSYLDGRGAEVAAWNVALSDDDIIAYDSGVSPLLIRPDALVHYWPLIGKQSPEFDLVSGYGFTLNNAPTVAVHPRIYMPPRKKMYVIRTATRELSFSASLSRPVALQREGQVNRAVIVKRTARKTSVASRLFSALIGRTAAVDVNLHDLFQHVLSAAVSRTASVSLHVIQGARKFVGSAGLGLLFRPKTRWDRRRPRR